MVNKIERANTDYDDLRGTVAVDFAGGLGISEFENYAESIGIDLSKFCPLGFEISGSDNFEIGDSIVTIFVIDKEKKEKYQSENDGKLPVVKLRHADTFLNLLKSIYRLSVICMTGGYGDSDNLSKLDIIENINIEKEEDEEK